MVAEMKVTATLWEGGAFPGASAPPPLHALLVFSWEKGGRESLRLFMPQQRNGSRLICCRFWKEDGAAGSWKGGAEQYLLHP